MKKKDLVAAGEHEPSPNVRITPGALRMRGSRQRRREGLRCITFEMRDTEIDRLTQLGLLDVLDRDDHAKIVQALYEFLDSTALSGRRRRG